MERSKRGVAGRQGRLSETEKKSQEVSAQAEKLMDKSPDVLEKVAAAAGTTAAGAAAAGRAVNSAPSLSSLGVVIPVAAVAANVWQNQPSLRAVQERIAEKERYVNDHAALVQEYVSSGEADTSLDVGSLIEEAILWAKGREQRQLEEAGRRAGLTKEQSDKWRAEFDEEKHKDGYRPSDNRSLKELERSAREWLEHWGR